MLFDCSVEVLNVCTVMHIVVQGHRLFVDNGFERRIVVRQGGEFVSHDYFLQILIVLMIGKGMRIQGGAVAGRIHNQRQRAGVPSASLRTGPLHMGPYSHSYLMRGEPAVALFSDCGRSHHSYWDSVAGIHSSKKGMEAKQEYGPERRRGLRQSMDAPALANFDGGSGGRSLDMREEG